MSIRKLATGTLSVWIGLKIGNGVMKMDQLGPHSVVLRTTRRTNPMQSFRLVILTVEDLTIFNT